jgi:hypothetical protein
MIIAAVTFVLDKVVIVRRDKQQHNIIIKKRIRKKK